MEKHIIPAFAEPITDLPTEPQMTPEELKRRFQAPSEELREAHNALAKEVNGITSATYPDTVTESMLTPEIRQAISSKADAAENTAAHAALQTAIEAKGAFALGTYTGDGENSQTISLGFAPKAVLVLSENGTSVAYRSSTYYYGGLALPGHPVKYSDTDVVTLTENGFTVYYAGTYGYVRSNMPSEKYHYLALK